MRVCDCPRAPRCRCPHSTYYYALYSPCLTLSISLRDTPELEGLKAPVTTRVSMALPWSSPSTMYRTSARGSATYVARPRPEAKSRATYSTSRWSVAPSPRPATCTTNRLGWDDVHECTHGQRVPTCVRRRFVGVHLPAVEWPDGGRKRVRRLGGFDCLGANMTRQATKRAAADRTRRAAAARRPGGPPRSLLLPTLRQTRSLGGLTTAPFVSVSPLRWLGSSTTTSSSSPTCSSSPRRST